MLLYSGATKANMTIQENLLGTLRRMWGKPDATAAELDQHAADLLAQEQEEEEQAAEEEEEQAAEEDTTAEVRELRSALAEQERHIEALNKKLDSATQTIVELQERLDALEKLAPGVVSYETETSKSAEDEPWICETTRRAMAKERR